MITAVVHHLWQSTLFALAAALLVLAFRGHGAHVRYWLWFAASIKFLLPFALLTQFGSSFEDTRLARTLADSPAAAAIEQLTYPPPLEIRYESSAGPPSADWLAVSLAALWVCGTLAILAMRVREWLRIRTLLRASTPLDLGLPVPVRSAPGLLEPGVAGIRKPVLLLPAGIERQLTPGQLETVIGHELAHVRRRDNLLSSLQMLVETLFWFHPLVWWIGARLIEERERACDEAVLSLGAEPRTYADGILNVCKLYTESPLACMAGVSGADLRKRIEAIMTNPSLRRLNAPMKAALAAVVCAALVLPIGLGLLRAQDLAFEVAAIKPAAEEYREVEVNGRTRTVARFIQAIGGPGTDTPRQITYRNQSISSLMMAAYGVRSDEVILPNGFDRTRAYDMVVGVPEGATPAQVPAMLQNLLRERFGLRFHREPRERDVYVVKMASSGPKFKESLPAPPPENPKPVAPFPLDDDGFLVLPPDFTGMRMMGGGGSLRLSAQRFKAGDLLHALENYLMRQVVDETGLTGEYDFRFRFGPTQRPNTGLTPAEMIPTVREALEDLGFRFESAKRPVEVLVVDAVNPNPTEN